jgi:proteasome lid subunit RPN8/RPN11
MKAALQESGPDAKQLAGETLGTAPFPGQASGLRVYFEQAVHDAIHKHASEDTSVEICGVLVGVWKKDAGGMGPYVHVSASIRGEAAASKLAEVTFTHETWSKINAKMDKDYTDKVIVGWYHTHPDFGIFLSDRDTFIHQHFFSAPGQIALVVDPIRHEEGVFVWGGGKPVLSPTHFVGTGLKWSPSQHPSSSKGAANADDQPAGEEKPGRTQTPAAAAPSPLSLTGAALYIAAAAGLVAAGFFAASYNQEQQHVLVARALAEQLYNRTSSPEARRSLMEVRALLSEIGDEAGKLTEPKKEGVEPRKPEQVTAAIGRRVALANAELGKAIESQNLTIEQQAAIDWFVAQRLQAVMDKKLQDLIASGAITVTKPAEKDAKPAPAPTPSPDGAAPKPGAEPAKGGK